jgi:hypothetical protein
VLETCFLYEPWSTFLGTYGMLNEGICERRIGL